MLFARCLMPLPKHTIIIFFVCFIVFFVFFLSFNYINTFFSYYTNSFHSLSYTFISANPLQQLVYRDPSDVPSAVKTWRKKDRKIHWSTIWYRFSWHWCAGQIHRCSVFTIVFPSLPSLEFLFHSLYPIKPFCRNQKTLLLDLPIKHL